MRIGKSFRLGIHQFAPELCAPEANARKMATAAAESDAALVLTPELSLTGYNLGDDAATLAVPLTDRPDALQPIAELGEDAPDLIVGMVERGTDGVPYNAAVHLREGRIYFRHRKVYLPTYGMFDEGRFFGRGDRVDDFELDGGWRAGILVCEDFWHPSLIYLLATRGIHLLLVQAAGPGRGTWTGGAHGGRFATNDSWERIARTAAQLYGIYVALANRVGVEGGVVFGGESLIVDPTGEVVARGPSDAEAMVTADISLDRVMQARRPGAHIRDEDPHFVVRELNRMLEERR